MTQSNRFNSLQKARGRIRRRIEEDYRERTARTHMSGQDGQVHVPVSDMIRKLVNANPASAVEGDVVLILRPSVSQRRASSLDGP